MSVTKLDPWATICARFNRLETPQDKVNLFDAVSIACTTFGAIASYSADQDIRNEANDIDHRLMMVLTNMYRWEAGQVWESAHAVWSNVNISPEMAQRLKDTNCNDVFLFELSFHS